MSSANIRGVADRIKTAARRGVGEGIEAVRTAAIPLTPKGETGYLRASATISPIIATQQGLSVTLAYQAIYARYQHENYGANFTTPGTGAGYLERAGRENEQVVKQIIANHIKGALR